MENQTPQAAANARVTDEIRRDRLMRIGTANSDVNPLHPGYFEGGDVEIVEPQESAQGALNERR